MTELLHEARFTIALATPVDRAWDVLTNHVDLWWPRDYRAVEGQSQMLFEARLGGRLYEQGQGQDGVPWYTVQALAAPQSITMAGYVAPPFGGPALSLLRLHLSDQPDGSALLEVHDSIVGRANAKTVEAGWREIFAGLQARLG